VPKLRAKTKNKLWLVMWGRTLTKDTLTKSGWGYTMYVMCFLWEYRSPLLPLPWYMLHTKCFHCAFDSPMHQNSVTELWRWVPNFQGLEKVVVKFCLDYVFWSWWNTKNGACFDNFLLHDPCDISYRKVQWLLRRGTKPLSTVFHNIFRRSKWWAPICRRIDSG
jgi:hypothetical protein